MRRNILKVIYALLLTTLVIVAGLVSVTILGLPGQYKLLVVKSGSMEPSVPLGSIVVVQSMQDYNIGDVITFADPENTKYNITHRVIEKRQVENGILFETKGDANKTKDNRSIEPSLVHGKVTNTIPWIGYVVSFARTDVGLILLIVIPGTLIIHSEVIAIKKELEKIVTRRKVKA